MLLSRICSPCGSACFARGSCLFRTSRMVKTAATTASTTEFGRAASKIRFHVPEKPQALRRGEGIGGGPEGRMSQIRRTLTALFDEERIELPWHEATEARLYAERLIQEAILSSIEQDNVALFELWMKSEPGRPAEAGNFNPAILELASFYLKHPRLVEKLFKVFVPRYRFYNRPYTSIHRMPRPQYPSPQSGSFSGFAILELHGNPWPSVRAARGELLDQPFKPKFLINVLLDAVRASAAKKQPPTS